MTLLAIRILHEAGGRWQTLLWRECIGPTAKFARFAIV